MSLATHYLQIRDLHVACVALSGTLFAARGALALRGWPHVMHPVLRYGSMAIDTVLLAAGVALMFVIHQYPFFDGWLTAKLVLLVVYIVLGTLALKRVADASHARHVLPACACDLRIYRQHCGRARSARGVRVDAINKRLRTSGADLRHPLPGWRA